MIAIVDSKVGNLKSIFNALDILGADVVITDKPEVIEDAERIVVPGVGSFSAGVENLKKSGLIEPIRKAVQDDKKPFLGICLGMHLLGTQGHEYGDSQGLNLIPGEVKRLDVEDKSLKIPHMGWNEIALNHKSFLFRKLRVDKCFYFVHSFNFEVVDEKDVVATADYGGKFVAAIQRDNIIGLQFHPEKSQRNGLEFLENFLEWDPTKDA